MPAMHRLASMNRKKHRRRSQRVPLFEMLERRLAMTSGTYGIFSYESTAADVAITNCDPAALVANIPASINGLPVTSIAPLAFATQTIGIGDFPVEIVHSIVTVTIPDTVVRIGYGAFAGSSITSVTLPANVSLIDSYAFGDCEHLSAIDVAPSNSSYSSVGGVLYDKTGLLIACPAGKTGTYTIPNGTNAISYDAFANSKLASLLVPASVKTLVDNAFALTSVAVGFAGGPPSLIQSLDSDYTGPIGSVRYLATNAAWASYAGGKSFVGLPTTAVTVQAPTVVASVGDGSAKLTWTAASASDGTAISDYVVQYSSDNGKSWTTFNDGVSTATTATVTGLVNGKTYTFRVAASIDLGVGAFSTASQAVTPGTFGILKFIASGGTLTITGCDQKAKMAYIPATIGGVAVTAIGANAFQGCGSLTNIVVPASVTSIGATPFVGCAKLVDVEFYGGPPTLGGGLASGNPTIVRYVKGDPSWSGFVGKEFGGLSTQGIAPPVAPTATVVAGDRRATLTIAGRAGGTVTAPGLIFDVEVQYSGNGGTTWDSFGHLVPLQLSSTVVITGLTNGKTYSFRVAAKNLAGTGDFSNATSAVPAGLPGIPMGLKATKGDGKVTLSWMMPPSNGSPITQYRIQYSVKLGGLAGWGLPITSNQAANIFNQAVVGGLVNGKTYRFRIASVNAVGASDFSTPWVNATPGK